MELELVDGAIADKSADVAVLTPHTDDRSAVRPRPQRKGESLHALSALLFAPRAMSAVVMTRAGSLWVRTRPGRAPAVVAPLTLAAVVRRPPLAGRPPTVRTPVWARARRR